MADDRIDDARSHDESLADIIDAIQALDADDVEFVDPPDDVWDGIATALGDEVPDEATHGGPRAVTAVSSTPPLRSTTERRERLEQQQRETAFPARQLLLAAAAVVAVVALVAAFVVSRTDGPDTLATAELAYDPLVYDPLGENALASVRLVDDDGERTIRFDGASLPASELDDEDLELWLLEVDDAGAVAGLVSLGVVDDIDRAYAVPEGYDTDRYRVVDISVEPRDGDAQHSGRTILRGPLTT